MHEVLAWRKLTHRRSWEGKLGKACWLLRVDTTSQSVELETGRSRFTAPIPEMRIRPIQVLQTHLLQ